MRIDQLAFAWVAFTQDFSRPPDPKDVLREAVEAAQEIGDLQVRCYELMAAAQVQKRAGDPTSAAQTLSRVTKLVEDMGPDDESEKDYILEELAPLWASLGEAARAAELALQIIDARTAAEAFDGAVEECLGAKDWNGALQVAQAVKEELRRSELLAEIAEARIEAGELKEGLDLVDRIPVVAGRISVLRNAAVVAARAGDAPQSRLLFDRALELIVDQGNKQRWGPAGEFSKLASCYAEVGDVAGIQRLLQAMDRVRWESSPRRYASDMIQSILAAALAEKGDLLAALQSADAAGKLREEAYLQIAEVQADKHGDVAKALEILQALPADSKVLSKIARLHVRHGAIEEALRTALRIEGRRERREAYYLIAQAQVKNGDVEGALRTSREFSEAGWSSIIQDRVADGELQRAQECVRAYSGPMEKIQDAVLVLARALAESGDPQAAQGMVDRLPPPSKPKDVERRKKLVSEVEKAGMRTPAQLHERLQSIRSLADPREKARTLVDLAEAVLSLTTKEDKK